MADTQTPILDVNMSSAIESLKEYRAKIQELKAELWEMKEGTEEYNEKLEDLQKRQGKLNEFLQVTSTKAGAAAGSYNALSQEMARLKAEWKATGDEAKRQNLGVEINKINDQLKALDASTGNFQRNVGNYGSAFSEAFDKALGPLGKMSGNLGTLAKDVKGMVPLIKQVNTTAITGLQGIKAAIASTGIGLLVIAVGELAAHWEDIYKWVTGVNEATEALEQTQQKVTDATDEQMKNMGYQVQIMQAEGKTNVQILQYQIQEVKNAITKLKLYKEIVDKKIDELEAHNMLTKAFSGEYYLIDKLRESSNATATKITELSEKLEGLEWGLKAAEIRESVAALNESKKKGEEAAKKFQALKEQAEKFAESVKTAAKTMNDTELDKLTRKKDEQLATLQAYYDSGLLKEENYQEAKKAIEDKYRKEKGDIEEKQRNEEIEKTRLAARKASEAAIAEINQNAKNAKIFGDLDKQLKDLESQLSKNKQKFNFKDFWKGLFSNEDINKWKDNSIKAIEENFNKTKTDAENRITQYQNEMALYVEEDERYKELKKKIEEEKTAIQQAEAQKRVDITKAELSAEEQAEQKRQMMIATTAAGLNSISSLLQGLASLRQQELQQQVQNGKKSEEQAKKDFKRVKNMQIGAAIMATAAGVATALSGAFTTKSGPWDIALAAIQAAAIAASGAIQVAQIKKTQFGSTSSVNSSTPDLSNITNTYTPEVTSNVQTNSELENLTNAMGNIQPVVSVVDIEDAQNKVKVRDTESNLM